jgi:hypothetical protein
MRKRYIYVMFFGVPGLVVALIVAFFVFGAGAGFLWIFVFGDNPWPASAEKILPALFALVFLTAWLAVLIVGFRVGKRLENVPGLDRRHVLVSIAATAVPVALVVLHQWSVGNIGARPDSLLCGDFCSKKGFSASAMPPRNSKDRTCICIDDQGREAVKVPMDDISKSEVKGDGGNKV